MAKIPIIGGFNQRSDKQSANETSINIMSETYNGKTQRRLRTTPGLTLYTVLPEYPIRGAVELSDRAFVVAGTKLYETYEDGSFVERGIIGNNGNPASIDSNGLQLIVVDGERGWGMTLATNVFQQIVSTNFYPTRTINVVDGYAVGVREDTQQFFHSDLYDVFNWIFSDFASAEIAPDRLVVMVPDSVGLVALGTKSMEIYSGTTDPVQVFQRRTGYRASFGCAAPYTAVNAFNGAVWVGKDSSGACNVYRLNAGIPQVISTPAITAILQQLGDGIFNANAFTYQQAGHTFYQLNVPGLDTSFVYDFVEQEWHERRSYNTQYVWQRHQADCHMYIFGKNIVGSWNSGALFYIDPLAYTDNGIFIRRERTMTPLYDEEGDAYGQFSVFGLDCIVGMGDASGEYQDPQIAMETSNDNGITFGNVRTKSLGKIGKRLTQLRWKRCGYSRSRVFRVSTTAPVPFAIHRAWVE